MRASYNLPTILANLTVEIPAPYVPPPVEQASWATLKRGDRLRSTRPIEARAKARYATGTLFMVVGCDSQGVDLRPVARWTDREWRAAFTKERRPRVKKKPASPK